MLPSGNRTFITEFDVSKQTKLLFQQTTSKGAVEVRQYKNQRWLNIDTIEQTRIDIAHPEKLILALHQYFLTALLFMKTPENVLLGGLGGGALARFLHNKRPDINGTAFEIDKTIASLAREYFYYPKEKWVITIDDIQSCNEENFDFIIIDIAESDLTPDWLTSEKTLLRFKRQLSIKGVLAINLLLTDTHSLSETLSRTRKIFERRTLCVSVPDHRNIILFAFNHHAESDTINDLKIRAENLTNVWGVDFSTLLDQVLHDNPEGSGII